MEHPFESRYVNSVWKPDLIRCLIVGESPGNPGAPYFYDPIPTDRRDPVGVRRVLLAALHAAGWIAAPSLEAFKAAGFLFDHAVRCQRPMAEIDGLRARARRFRGAVTPLAEHLRPLLEEAEQVWAMGALARQAIADLDPTMPRLRRPLTPPYVSEGTYPIVISRYFTRIGAAIAADLVRQVRDLIGEPPPHRDCPSELSISIGGYTGPSYSLELHGPYLIYQAYAEQHGLVSKWKLQPTPDQWREFWAELDRIDVWHWEANYDNPDILDGTGWRITIAHADRRLATSGSNASPGRDSFDAFWQALRTLISDLEFR
ncbi:MAG TPA: hypothetical protein VEB21_04135 [Terriglobales bacterium]|nr:hypothetical protein [Terriglobales bacterium]